MPRTSKSTEVPEWRSAADAARADLDTARALQQEWADRATSVRESHRRAEASAGARALEAGDGGLSVAADLAQLVGGIRVAEKALAEQDARVAAAAARYLAAEAVGLRVEVDAIAEQVRVHEARTEELRAAMVAHAGQFEVRWTDATVWPLRSALAVAQARAAAVEMLAAGEDPQPWLQAQADSFTGRIGDLTPAEIYPDFVTGPDAVVAAPKHLAQVAQARRTVADLEALQPTLVDDIAALETELQLTALPADQRAAAAVERTKADRDPALTPRVGALLAKRSRLEDLADELPQARAALEALVGDAAVA